MATPSLAVAFFDIGNTLGDVDGEFVLHPYATTPRILEALRGGLGLRLGVITNVPADWTAARVHALLQQADIADHFDPIGLVTNVAAGTDKPAVEVYRYAATRMGVETSQCLYVGDDVEEVRGAITAGMAAIRRPPPGL